MTTETTTAINELLCAQTPEGLALRSFAVRAMSKFVRAHKHTLTTGPSLPLQPALLEALSGRSPVITTVPAGWVDDGPFEAWAGGAAPNKPGAIGAASIIVNALGAEMEAAQGHSQGTHNEADLLGIILAIESTPPGSSVLVHTESKLAVKSYNVWLQEWKAQGWTKAGGFPLANAALWRRLDALAASHTVSVKHTTRAAGGGRCKRAHLLAEMAALRSEAAEG